MKHLKIDLPELEMAFENYEPQAEYHMDLETGEVLFVNHDDRSWLESLYEAYYDEQTESLEWERVFQEEGMQDWQKDNLQQIDLIESGYGTRFITIPPESSHLGFEDMQEFIQTVRNPRLQDRLEDAISGRSAFRRFKDVLHNYPAERGSGSNLNGNALPNACTNGWRKKASRLSKTSDGDPLIKTESPERISHLNVFSQAVSSTRTS